MRAHLRACLILPIVGASLAAGGALAQSPSPGSSIGQWTTPSTVVPPAGRAPAAVTALPFSLAQTATGFTATNVAFAIGPTTYRAPRAELRGVSLPREQLASLLDPGSSLTAGERLQRLAASEIVLPELISEMPRGTGRETTTYRNVTLRDVAAGRIGSAVAEGGTMERSTGEGVKRGSFGRFELGSADLGLVFQLFNVGAPGAAKPLAPIYGSFSMLNLRLADDDGGVTSVGRLSGRDFAARPTPDGWAGTVAKMGEAPDLGKASPEVRGRALGAIADLFDAFEFGSLEATSIEFGSPKPDAGSGKIARIAYTGGEDRPGEFRIEGLAATGTGGRVAIAEIALGGVSLKPMLAAARELGAAMPGELGPGEIRRLIPTIGLFRVSGLEVDTVPDKPGPGVKATKFGVGTIEILADKPRDGIPTDLRAGIRNVSFEIGTGTETDPLKDMAALGYSRFDMSFGTNLGWNEAGQELVLRDLSLRGSQMGSLAVRAIIGGVTKDVFDPDQAVAMIALVGAAAKSIDLTVENDGLFERLLAREAAAKGKSTDELRRDYGLAAAVGIPAMLGTSQAAKTLGQAIARFVAKPGKLTLQARAKEPAGLGFADFVAAPDPTMLLDKVEITATVE